MLRKTIFLMIAKIVEDDKLDLSATTADENHWKKIIWQLKSEDLFLLTPKLWMP